MTIHRSKIFGLFLYDVTVVYETKSGILPVPHNNGVRHVRTHKPYQTKAVNFTIYATGEKPPIPSSKSENTNEVLIHEHREFAEPFIVNRFGKSGFLLTGTYVYSMVTPVTEDTGFAIPFPPYYRGNYKVTFRGADFIKGYH